MGLITEAYDVKGTKYKIGMEVLLPGGTDLWYITKIELGQDNKVGKLYLINNKFDTLEEIQSMKHVTLTGYFKPEFSKIFKELDKRDYWEVKKNVRF